MNKPCISQYIEVYFENNGKIAVFNKLTKKTYAIGSNEYKVLQNLDGTKTLNDLSLASGVYSVNDIERLIGKFEKIGFIKNKEIKEKFNILKIRKGLVNPNKLINPNSIVVRLIYFILVYVSIPIFAVGIYLGYKNFNIILKILENSITSPSSAVFIPTILVVLFLHEMGHTIIARYNGVNVPELGIMLYWFMPCAYTNLSGMSFIQGKFRKLSILFGGILVNLSLSGSALLLLRLSNGFMYEFLLWFSIMNASYVFVNLLIFLKLDGYFILQELLCENKLREKSFAYILSFRQKLKINNNKDFRYDSEFIDNSNSSNQLNNIVYTIYGLFSILYIPLIILTLVSTFIALF